MAGIEFGEIQIGENRIHKLSSVVRQESTGRLHGIGLNEEGVPVVVDNEMGLSSSALLEYRTFLKSKDPNRYSYHNIHPYFYDPGVQKVTIDFLNPESVLRFRLSDRTLSCSDLQVGEQELLTALKDAINERIEVESGVYALQGGEDKRLPAFMLKADKHPGDLVAISTNQDEKDGQTFSEFINHGLGRLLILDSLRDGKKGYIQKFQSYLSGNREAQIKKIKELIFRPGRTEQEDLEEVQAILSLITKHLRFDGPMGLGDEESEEFDLLTQKRIIMEMLQSNGTQIS